MTERPQLAQSGRGRLLLVAEPWAKHQPSRGSCRQIYLFCEWSDHSTPALQLLTTAEETIRISIGRVLDERLSQDEKPCPERHKQD